MPADRLRPSDLEFEPPALALEVVCDAARESYGVVGTPTVLKGERDQNVVEGQRQHHRHRGSVSVGRDRCRTHTPRLR